MISTFSERKTTATIALRRTEVVVTCLHVRFFFFHVQEFAGPKLGLKFILFSLTFWSAITFCHCGMGSCFETEITTAGKTLTNLLWFWRIRLFLWVGALPFQQNIVHHFRCWRIFPIALWCTQIIQARPLWEGSCFLIPLLLWNRTTLNPCLCLGRCSCFHPRYDWARALSGSGLLKRHAEKRSKTKIMPLWVTFCGKHEPVGRERCFCELVCNTLISSFFVRKHLNHKFPP